MKLIIYCFDFCEEVRPDTKGFMPSFARAFSTIQCIGE